jgi:hypothetical protein
MFEYFALTLFFYFYHISNTFQLYNDVITRRNPQYIRLYVRKGMIFMKTIVKKPLFTLALVAISVIVIGVGAAFAAQVSTTPTTTSTVATATTTPVPGSTEKIVRPDLAAAFEGLTDAQKAELYKISDEIESGKAAILDKLVEFGKLDAATAKIMKENAASRYAQMKEDGKFFGPGMGRRGKMGGEGMKPPEGKGDFRGRRGPGCGDRPCIDPNVTGTPTTATTATPGA